MSSPLTWTLASRPETNPLIEGIGLGLTIGQVFEKGLEPVSGAPYLLKFINVRTSLFNSMNKLDLLTPQEL